MTSVSVLVPFRGDPGGYRDAVWSWLRGWWTEHHPDWQVMRGFCPEGPWVKALAVADALCRSDGDVVLVVDADVFCGDFQEAIAAVERGFGWAVPHGRVHRLSRAATDLLTRTGQLPDPSIRPARRGQPARDILESYTGVAGGGAVALLRSTYREAPLDPRFHGYGQEDSSWGLALAMLTGTPWRGTGPLWHLHHPPQPRMTRAVGSHASLELLQQYRGATSKERMQALLAECAPVVC